jgi:hypothetical protein
MRARVKHPKIWVSNEPEWMSILRLWWALRETFGESPRFELWPGKYAYVLWFTRSKDVTVATVRTVVDENVPFGVGIRLGDRDPIESTESKNPPWFR